MVPGGAGKVGDSSNPSAPIKPWPERLWGKAPRVQPHSPSAHCTQQLEKEVWPGADKCPRCLWAQSRLPGRRGAVPAARRLAAARAEWAVTPNGPSRAPHPESCTPHTGFSWSPCVSPGWVTGHQLTPGKEPGNSGVICVGFTDSFVPTSRAGDPGTACRGRALGQGDEIPAQPSWALQPQGWTQRVPAPRERRPDRQSQWGQGPDTTVLAA